MAYYYKRNTLASFTLKLEKGRYPLEGSAKCAVTRSQDLSTREKSKAYKAIRAYYADPPKPKKSGNGNAIKKATTKAFKKGEPFEVQFARVVMNGTMETTLSFLRGAADRGYTLPQLISSIELV